MEYRTVYDLGSSGFEYWAMLAWAGLIAFLALALMARARLKGNNPFLAKFLFVFAILFADFSFAMPYLDYSRLSAVLKDGQTLVANGYVSKHAVSSNLKFIGSRLVRESQSFNVNGVKFNWHQPTNFVLVSEQNPFVTLEDGQALRVTYVEDGEGAAKERLILRLELATTDQSLASL